MARSPKLDIDLPRYPGSEWTAGILTLQALLIEKGIITPDEWDEEFGRRLAEVRQEMDEKRGR